MKKIINANKKIISLFVFGLVFLVAGFVLQDNKTLNAIKDRVEDDNKIKEVVLEDNKEKIVEKDPNIIYVTIANVIDGDTIETDNGERIRYIGINAPEKGEPKSTESMSLNKILVLGKKVRLEFDVQGKDRYGRTLAYVFVGSGQIGAEDTFVNMEMIKKGLAVSETITPNVKYQKAFVNSQKQARESCFGIWEGLCGDSTSALGEESKACVFISSINADAIGNDNTNKNGEWIEIKNRCDENILMKGWLIKDSSASNKYIFKEFTILSSVKVTVYSGCGRDSSDELYWKCPEGKYAVWNNDADHAFLYNEKEELVSDFKY